MSDDPLAADLLGHVKTLMRVMLVSERTGAEHQHVVRFNALDFHILNELREGRACRASDLVAALGIAPTTASSAIARLVRQGLVARHQSRTDRRAFDLSLSPAGQAQADAIHAQDMANMRLFLSALERGEQREIIALLDKIAARVAALEG